MQKSILDDDDLVSAECSIVGLTLDDLRFVLKRKEHGPERRTLKIALESTDFTEEELRLIFAKIIQVLRE